MTLQPAHGKTSVEALVAAELAEPVDPRVAKLAAAIAARHDGTLGVVFYGSCLRDATLGGMLDFYLIVEDYGRAYQQGWLARANALLPPNVFPFAADGLSAKYAVLDLGDLRRECSADARDPSTFARFAQPVRLMWVASSEARGALIAAVAQAPRTLLALAAARPPHVDVLDDWRSAFRATYKSELRAERGSRPDAIVDAEPERYRRLGEAVRDEGLLLPPGAARAAWVRLLRRAKRRQLAKLAKASLTFAGGIDYLAWKINRHAGTKIAVTPWQRRHPLLAALTLLPRLIRSGAVR